MQSLAELERTNPKLGAELGTFIRQVGSACWDAYKNVSKVLSKVIALREPVEPAALDAVLTELAATYDHQWFKTVADVCARLAAADAQFGTAVQAQASYSRPKAGEPSLSDFIAVLRQGEGVLESEIKTAVGSVQWQLSQGQRSGDLTAAKREARDLQSQIEARTLEIRRTVQEVLGTSAAGAEEILNGWDEKAEGVLRADPHAQLKLNALILVALASLGAGMLQVIPLYAFPLVTVFALAGLVVLNAIQLRNSNKLSEARFIELMKLALLKFYLPLSGKYSRAHASGTPSGGG